MKNGKLIISMITVFEILFGAYLGYRWVVYGFKHFYELIMPILELKGLAWQDILFIL